MKLSLEHERLVRMLRESISLMCKSALSYDSELNIEGLLGITLDKQDVFLVNINSNFQQELPTGKCKKLPEDAAPSESDTHSSEEGLGDSPSSRKRRRKHRKKHGGDDSGVPSVEDDLVCLSDSPSPTATPKLEDSSSRPSCEFSSHLSEAGEGQHGESSSVFIKKEILDCSSDRELSNFDDVSGDFKFPGSGELGSVGQSPYPVSGPVPSMSGDGSMQYQAFHSQAGNLDPSQPGTSASTDPGGSRHEPTQNIGFISSSTYQLHPQQKISTSSGGGAHFECPICAAKFTLKRNFVRHYNSVHRGMGVFCQHCGKRYRDHSAMTKHIALCAANAKAQNG